MQEIRPNPDLARLRMIRQKSRLLTFVLPATLVLNGSVAFSQGGGGAPGGGAPAFVDLRICGESESSPYPGPVVAAKHVAERFRPQQPSSRRRPGSIRGGPTTVDPGLRRDDGGRWGLFLMSQAPGW